MTEIVGGNKAWKIFNLMFCGLNPRFDSSILNFFIPKLMKPPKKQKIFKLLLILAEKLINLWSYAELWHFNGPLSPQEIPS